MAKKLFTAIILTVFAFINTTPVWAALHDRCGDPTDNVCDNGLVCMAIPGGTGNGTCEVKIGLHDRCNSTDKNPNNGCNDNLACKEIPGGTGNGTCEQKQVQDIFGKIAPPSPLATLMGKDTTGTLAISKFLTSLIRLIYSLAGIALVLMLVWGAFDWLISGGEKEKIANAQKKLINAVIGIVLLAIAFAVMRVIGVFTGFTFFIGQ